MWLSKEPGQELETTSGVPACLPPEGGERITSWKSVGRISHLSDDELAHLAMEKKLDLSEHQYELDITFAPPM